MKKIRSLLFLVFIAVLPLATQGQNRSIKAQAMDMATAFIKNDFNNFVKYMHPDVVELAGGRENMKAKMDSAYAAMKQFNVSFKKYSIGDPAEVIKHKDQLQTVLPQSTIMVTPFGELHAESSMVAISNDKGKTWWFIDTNMYSLERLKRAKLELSPKLVLPPRKQPKMVPLKDDKR